MLMNFRDRWDTDADGKKFIFTVEQQRRLHEEGLPVEPASLATLKERYAPPPAPSRNREREHAPEPERIEEIQIDAATGKYIGKLLSFDGRKGFGFISHGADRLYFHRRRSLDDPRYMSMGQKVLYDVNEYRGKTEAIDVEEYEEPMEMVEE